LTQGLEGLSIVKPPYGVLTAIDLNTGTIKFKVPHGDTPDAVRAALERLGINYPEKTGQGGSVGLMVTKTLVVVGDPQMTAQPGRASCVWQSGNWIILVIALTVHQITQLLEYPIPHRVRAVRE